ncbi:hypothetical protein CLV37_1533 [Kineococcus rhizosphaerae]|uniref:Uncharacterized protein n=1 Tax=Kineococcus rhizosphaerae TaxID=559628 RepID=A0A2T0QIL7_9ACTN|nr:hypothetical protein CLV37_1533 [Kineococcus rhizosphaerae]
MLIEAHDEWQSGERRYLSEASMALLTPPEPTVLPTAALRADVDMKRHGFSAVFMWDTTPGWSR